MPENLQNVDPNQALVEMAANQNQFIHNEINEMWELHCNATVTRHEDWIRYMAKVTQVRQNALIGVTDLTSRGLVASEEFTTTLIGVEKINEFRAAIQSMGEVTDENDDSVYTEDLTPLPITAKGWSIQARQNQSYKMPAGVGASTRSVSERLEDMLFNGSPAIVTGGGTVYGYTTHPNRYQNTITDWSDFPTNGDKIVNEMQVLIQRLIDEAHVKGNNKIMIYIPTNFSASFKTDYKAEADKTVRTRILDENPEVIDIKVGHDLAAGLVALVALEEDTIEMGRALDIQIIPHLQTKGILSARKFTTAAIMVPVFKPDSQNNLAVLTASTGGG